MLNLSKVYPLDRTCFIVYILQGTTHTMLRNSNIWTSCTYSTIYPDERFIGTLGKQHRSTSSCFYISFFEYHHQPQKKAIFLIEGRHHQECYFLLHSLYIVDIGTDICGNRQTKNGNNYNKKVVHLVDWYNFVMMQVDVKQLFCCKAFLKSSAGFTGLKVNFHKSCLVPINVPSHKLPLLTRVFRCLGGQLPFTYLGIPLRTTKPPVKVYVPLICQNFGYILTSNLLYVHHQDV